jgi:hemoglobin-like flavoprotein
MRRVLLAFVLLFACWGQALSIEAPSEVPTNSAFSVAIEFDALGSFSEATVQLDGSNVVSMQTIAGNALYVITVDQSKVLNLGSGEIIQGNRVYLLFAGFESEGETTIAVEEAEKEPKSATVKIFAPAAKDFEEEYLQQFTSLKNTIMSYANDIDDLKEIVNALDELAASNQASSSEFQSKLNELNSALENISLELESKASVEQLQEKIEELQEALNEQAGKVDELEQETKEIASSGFVSFAGVQGEKGFAVIGGIIVIAITLALAARGKLPPLQLPKKKGGKSIYRPSERDGEITSQVLEEAGELRQGGRWAFKAGSWKPPEEKEERPSSLGDLIKRN